MPERKYTLSVKSSKRKLEISLAMYGVRDGLKYRLRNMPISLFRKEVTRGTVILKRKGIIQEPDGIQNSLVEGVLVLGSRLSV